MPHLLKQSKFINTSQIDQQKPSVNFNITKKNIKRKLFNVNLSNLFLNVTSLLLIVIIVMLILNPTRYMSSVIAGLKLFFYAVVPSLLPFLFISKLLTELKVMDKLSKLLEKPIRYLFHAPPVTSYVFFMSIICGYPIGAKLIGDLYENKSISSNEAKSMFAICSTSGPIFVIGTVGAGLLKDVKLGMLIFICHLISSIICGMIFANRKEKNNLQYQKPIKQERNNILVTSVNSTISSILTIAIYVSIFYMFIDIAYDLKILGISEKIISSMLKIFNINVNFAKGLSSGIVEMTRGCAEISLVQNKKLQLIFSSALISFSGLSIIVQSLTFMSKTKINTLYILLVKCVQSLISIFVAIFLSLFI